MSSKRFIHLGDRVKATRKAEPLIDWYFHPIAPAPASVQEMALLRCA